jgi:beta-lactamase regulating signal transducer with metallopeptidase domain
MNTFPVLMILAQWTGLLALGWTTHWLLRKAHSRWRVILWRGILCAGLLVPVMQFFPVHIFRVPIYEIPVSPLGITDALPSAASGNSASTSQPTVPAPAKTDEVNNTVKNPISLPQPRTTKNIPWQNLILIVWASVAALGAFRLIRLQWQLSRVRRESRPATPVLQEQARDIQAKLGVKQTIDVRVSDSIISSFACGLLKPAILISQKLAGELSSEETSVLVAHEIAHFRRHDLFWCIAWRWMQALFWFHPLVWKIPTAHNLACEQESDRLASGQMPDHSDYMQSLARLALRVLALPAVESRLVLNGASQIAERLNHLRRGKEGNWNWKYSAAAFGLVAVLFLMATGCDFSKKAPQEATIPKNTEFKKVLVVVQDQDGKPIEGASIQPDGFRVKGIHGADAYGWMTKKFGPPEKVTTDKDGKAWLKYPVMGISEEKELTGALIFSVYHPEYCTARIQTFHVDGSDNPVRMERGLSMEVSGYYGIDHEPVQEIIPNLSEEEVRTNDWVNEGNGVLSFHKLSSGDHLIQLMGRLPSGEIVYSDDAAFTAVEGKPCKLELEMKPGIRLEGRLDDNVPRPVKNGRVLISVRPKEFPAWNNFADIDDIFKKYPNFYFWKSYRPIAADGTFVFESIPPGGLDVIVHGDGFASKDGAQFQQRVGSKVEKINGFAVPQAFALAAPVTKIEVITEPTATLELTAKTKSGKPIDGANVGVNPNVIRIGGLFGDVRRSSEDPFRELTPLPRIPYTATTDKNGLAVIRNIPASDNGMEIYDPQYQVPLQNKWRSRDVHITLSPGATNQLTVTMEPKGADYIGTAR